MRKFLNSYMDWNILLRNRELGVIRAEWLMFIEAHSQPANREIRNFLISVSSRYIGSPY